MSNFGRKLRRWTYSEITRLHQLYDSGKSRAEIATELNMEEDRIRQRLQWEAKAGILKNARRRRRAASTRTDSRAEQRKSPREYFDVVIAGPKPTESAVANQKERFSARHRDLAGAIFGDPPIGFSALDKRQVLA